MTEAMFCLAIFIGIFIGIGLTLFALWLWETKDYPEELEEEEN